MCGFVTWADSLHSIEKQKLEQMRDLLQHRGPDARGSFVSSDSHVGLGFRRLSIIDLSPAGNQPMSNEDGSIQIVFNGEVYNFSEIRPELEARGHHFRSQTDTEVILHAYEEWGENCVVRLIGMFAFAIWDSRQRRLFAVRDRLGIKPLYYSATDCRIILASELKPIMDAPGFSRDLDTDALQEYLARGYISSPMTIFKFARSLPPGHFLIWSQDTGEVSLNQYWDPLKQLSNEHPKQEYSEQEWIDALEGLLRSSIKYRLISDVPLGVFLSGGIDSSLVTALMCQVAGTQVKTFTIGFKETDYDEGIHAQNVAEYLGTVHTPLEVSYRDAQQLIPHLPEFYDEPFADSSQIPTLLVSRLARQHVTVALSGDGGDEMFGGYETYRLMERWQYLWKLPQSIRNGIQRVVGLFPDERLRLAGRGLALPDPVTFASYFNAIWRPQEIALLLPGIGKNLKDATNDPVARYLGQNSHRFDLLEKLMLIDLQRYLPNDILTKVDRASMAFSLEARVPLLDHRVVELALRMPISLKRRNGESKFALRQILYRYMPRELVDRPKQGFSVPLDYWLKTDLRGLVKRNLDPVLLQKQGLFNIDVVRHHVDRFMAGQSSHSRVWSLLVFQMWAERYLGLKV
jgi:asparagine synthase (glutamine-hydrolysing)